MFSRVNRVITIDRAAPLSRSLCGTEHREEVRDAVSSKTKSIASLGFWVVLRENRRGPVEFGFVPLWLFFLFFYLFRIPTRPLRIPSSLHTVAIARSLTDTRPRAVSEAQSWLRAFPRS